jgi:hypothetical protein
MNKVKTIMFFPNGNTGVFNDKGEQVSELQEGWINWKQIKSLAYLIANDPKIEVRGECPHLNTYIQSYRKLGKHAEVSDLVTLNVSKHDVRFKSAKRSKENSNG